MTTLRGGVSVGKAGGHGPRVTSGVMEPSGVMS